MPLSNIGKKALNHSIKELYKTSDDLAKLGIFVHIDEDNLAKLYALIIGVDDTPYQGGFFFFELKIVDGFPVKPPKVTFLSTASGVRIHPNLYTEGKVCLSIINTWDGDGWSPSYTLGTLLMAIQSYIFVKHPLHNEPGYEKESEGEGGTVETYSRYVTYQNIRTCINNMLEHLPSPIASFRPVLDNHLRANGQKYFKYIRSLVDTYDGKTISSTAYSGSTPCVTNYTQQYERFSKYCASLGIMPEEAEKTVSKVPAVKGSKKKSKMKELAAKA